MRYLPWWGPRWGHLARLVRSRLESETAERERGRGNLCSPKRRDAATAGVAGGAGTRGRRAGPEAPPESSRRREERGEAAGEPPPRGGAPDPRPGRRICASTAGSEPWSPGRMLNKFSCIALAGVATEYILYGIAEGGLADINKLDGLLKSLGFTQKKADSQVRWAVLNTVLILRRHEKARSQLAEAMSLGKSVGSCIEVIEGNISMEDI
ncbi:hypothetical protein PR202_ga22828 [Eleusine coracana subsp. coracana]|uniref:Stress regulated protein n=1 Tax=Eleusine coracana subsp. coracana TaxID=191504 RepID=A0AAV5D2P6_ELECO|nr:hypothetical protein PR202_ga22828 [Eleusine coracana subsp. coracana]